MPLPDHLRLSTIESANATVDIPGSKSITNRALLLAALATGRSTLNGILRSDDTVAMTRCLKTLGVTSVQVAADVDVVEGCAGQFSAASDVLFTNNSGTTIRFLTAAAALSPSGTEVVLDGIARMRQRPIIDLVDAVRHLGVSATTSPTGCPPVNVNGGGIDGGRCIIKGTMSSQYLSAILMVSPLAKNNVHIDIDGELVSKPYVDMTISMMKSFGAIAENHDYRSFQIPAQQKYFGNDYSIEPDASNASYFLAAAAVTGGTVTVSGLGTQSIQGDVAFIDVLELMGCSVSRTANSLTVIGQPVLKSIDFDASAIPDMAQTIALVALFADGTTTLTGLSTLRIKETDRINAVAVELRKLGATVDEGPDWLSITPPKNYNPASIDTYDDHRMAMSFAIAGLRIPGVVVNDPGCVAKTFPDFWDRWSVAFPGSVIFEE